MESKPREKLQLRPPVDSWMRIGSKANDKAERFNNLFCHLNVENLREAYRALDGSKARGVDGKTKRQYGEDLESNLADLLQRLHRGTYRPQPKRGILIPKANGKMRPIAISSFEDKLVEWVVGRILSLVYEPLFIQNSFGFRPRRGAHDALKAACVSLNDDERPYVVEIDLKSFFDTVPHRKLMKILRVRITDHRFRSLIARFLQAGVLQEGGAVVRTDTGTAQGAIISPILANVYLHYCLDKWFLENYASKQAVIIRYADDAIFAFKEEEQAEQFQQALKAKLAEYGLTLNEEKSGMLNFRKHQGNVFHFLGFTFFWGTDRTAKTKRLRLKTEKTRLYKKIGEFSDWLREQRSRLKLDIIWEAVAAKLRGHYNYYGVATNRRQLNRFYHAVVGLLFKWLNRRSQRKSFTWERFVRRLGNHPLPTPPPGTLLKLLNNKRVYV